jgi:hypothetical protein
VAADIERLANQLGATNTEVVIALLNEALAVVAKKSGGRSRG